VREAEESPSGEAIVREQLVETVNRLRKLGFVCQNAAYIVYSTVTVVPALANKLDIF
jgi:hypothetical protein